MLAVPREDSALRRKARMTYHCRASPGCVRLAGNLGRSSRSTNYNQRHWPLRAIEFGVCDRPPVAGMWKWLHRSDRPASHQTERLMRPTKVQSTPFTNGAWHAEPQSAHTRRPASRLSRELYGLYCQMLLAIIKRQRGTSYKL